MTSTQCATNMARAFIAAEMVMAVANSGGSIAGRARAEKMLDDYFAPVDQARSPGQSTIRLIGGPDPSIHNRPSGESGAITTERMHGGEVT